jgi:hypothetical protein
MKAGGLGGANTRTGIVFEGRMDLIQKFEELEGYEVRGNVIYYLDQQVALYFKKSSLYRLLEGFGVDY